MTILHNIFDLSDDENIREKSLQKEVKFKNW